MSRCERADAEVGGVYVCQREEGHGGPCVISQCGAVEPTVDTYPASQLTCSRAVGHAGPHRVTIEWS